MQIARQAALTKHALGDPVANTEPARRAADARFAQRVLEAAEERGEVLTEAELSRRTERLRRAHYVGMARKSAKARRRAGSSRGDPP